MAHKDLVSPARLTDEAAVVAGAVASGSAPTLAQVLAEGTGASSITLFFGTKAGLPTTFEKLLVVDTTNKHLYVWDGTAYVKVSDYA